MSNEETIFAQALALGAESDRCSFLDRACAGDEQLRGQVEALLKAHQNAGGLLESPPAGLGITEAESFSPERIGSSVGPYKLLEQIGGGGMGVVYMAEQIRPVRRKVALKIIKPGMDSRQVIARFEAERQALTMMDHPNIAKVLDAGTTESGRPYFVMELVKGIPITDYCDQAKLNTRQRLELFIDVCHAVQHAHQKGIIHRDIKPGNVLVTLHDDKPVTKVIDFGIAKATSYQLTEKTLFTNFAQMMGTPLYMSPEQAQLSGLDVDTRSDVYSLGVLLYELLTGTTPFDKKRLVEAAYDEMRRIIREEEPPKPSTRLSTMGRKLTAISAQRQSDPKRLGQIVRGELDWIVMKALEKDRTRRYETASAFAADVERHLGDQAVEACPPSSIYRLRKLARRNKITLVAASMVLLFLVLVGSGIGWAIRDRAARSAERAGRRAKIAAQVDLILSEVQRLERAQKWDEALITAKSAAAALSAGESNVETQEQVRHALADLTLVSRIEKIRTEVGAIWNDTRRRPESVFVQADRDYAAAFREAGIDLDRLPAAEAADRVKLRSNIAPALLAVIDDWINVRATERDEPAMRRLRDVAQAADGDPWRGRLRDSLLPRDFATGEALAASDDLEQQSAATLSLLAQVLRDHKQLDVVVLRRAQLKYPTDYWINLQLAIHLVVRNPKYVEDGIGFARAAVALRPLDSQGIFLVGMGLEFMGRYEESLSCYRKAIALAPSRGDVYSRLGRVLLKLKRFDEANENYKTSIELSPTAKYFHLSFAEGLRRQGKLDEAIARVRAAMEMDPKVTDPQTTDLYLRLGEFLDLKGQIDESIACVEQFVKMRPNVTMGRARLGQLYAKKGDFERATECHREAISKLEQQLPEPNRSGGYLYDAACVYGIVSAARKDGDTLKEQYMTQVVVMLRRAGAEGFFRNPDNLEEFTTDPDFDSVRQREDFKKLVSTLGVADPAP